MLKLGHFGRQIRNSLRFFKCGAGEGWRRSVGLILCEMKKCYMELKEDRKILSVIHVKRTKADGIGHVLRMNCLLKHVTEGKIERMRRRGRRRKQPQDEVKAKIRYLSLEEEEPDGALWSSRFGGRCGPVGDTAQIGDVRNRL